MFRFVVLNCLVVALSGVCIGSDFELTIRSHSDRITFGDPLFIEVTLVNRGTKSQTAPAASMLAATLGLKVYDANTRLSMPLGETGGAWGNSQARYEPNQHIKHYWYVFLPGLRGFEHPFWKPIYSKGQSVLIRGAYWPSQKLSVMSNTIDVHVETREDEEMRSLEYWSKGDTRGFGKGPIPNDLGLQFKSGLGRQQTEELSKKIPSGEIHDLLLLSMHLRDIYDTSADSRDAKDKGLVEWLQKLPDIKRQCLIQEVRDVAENHGLKSTAEAVGKLIDWK